MADHKTEQPTPRRRQKAREQGQVARSRELSSALGVFALLVVVHWRSQADVRDWGDAMHSWLDAAGAGERLNVTSMMLWAATGMFRWALPGVVAGWAMVLAGSFVQAGFTWAPEVLNFRPDRMNPAERFKQLFSINSVASLLRSLVPGTAIVYLTIGVLAREWSQLKVASFRTGAWSALWIFALLYEIAWKCGLVMLVWSMADYLLVRYRVESDLKMSREELRQEHKESEGDPMVKGKIRRLQRQARRRKMLADVAKAAVVVTNPTHYAIALAYSGEMPSPVVVAKGRDRLAERIKEEARWNEVPTVENPPLAHALYRAVPIGNAIPPKLYLAVAEVLAYVYRAQARARAMAEALR
jgi:flagellar biosynthetic protein FlhB